MEYDDEDDEDEVLAFDANTLTLRFTFGRGIFKKDAFGITPVGNELYICDRRARSLQVFSLAGEHLREVRGDWRQPHSLCFFSDRLFLVERDGEDEENDDEYEEDEDLDDMESQAKREAGKRIFVLTPQGETLQVWKAPKGAGGVKSTWSMAIFEQELVVFLPDNDPRLLSLAGI